MFDLPRDVLGEAGLVLGQHLQHGAQVEPPLVLGHPVPGNNKRNLDHADMRCQRGQVIKRMRSVPGLLEVRHFFELRDRAEGHHLAVESQHARCLWGVGKHTACGETVG